MSSRLRDRLERMLKLIEELKADASRGVPIIVEGFRDVEALRELDVGGRIIPAKASGRTLIDLVEEVEGLGKPEVILLLDFDRRGREWTRMLTRQFERAGIRVNTNFWRLLSNLSGKEVKDVEGLLSYVKTLHRKAGRGME